MRKSPIRHHVRTHIRKNRPVHDYDRGHGSHAKRVIRRQTQQSPSGYIVYIKYAGFDSETIPVVAPDYPTAIENAMISRRSISPPTEIEVAKR